MNKVPESIWSKRNRVVGFSAFLQNVSQLFFFSFGFLQTDKGSVYMTKCFDLIGW